ncbi:MAG TPA: glutamate--tRNA ligase family protein, partial [Verrucomicrobiota bacterium]|nr:glutamate--tRNA ligase family protein [Verrucomicrobiota bacterium]
LCTADGTHGARGARAAGGTLVLRNDDLDRAGCKPEFVSALYDDLRWFGFAWDEGPDIGGPFAPYDQSRRMHVYRSALEQLIRAGAVYPCTCSRRDILSAARAPHARDDEEPIYPGTCRGRALPPEGRKFSWRFRVRDGEAVSFEDRCFGAQRFTAGRDFGDFVVWRHDDVPAYQLACVVDDAAMRITEVVRGADLLLSTARQLLLYRVLGLEAPRFYHCPLMTDETGVRLAKRHASLSLRTLREQGRKPEEFQREFRALQAGEWNIQHSTPNANIQCNVKGIEG